MARFRAARVLAAASVWASGAHAELPDRTAPPAELGAAAAPSTTTSDEEAARLFHEAEALYAQGDLPGALERMEAAYARSGRPELLFNLGELRRELGDCPLARKSYAEYLARVPEGRRRDEAAERQIELEERCPEPTPPVAAAAAPIPPAPPAPTVSPASAEPRPPYWTPATITGWATIGAGAAVAVAATVFAVQASHDETKLESHFESRVYTHDDTELQTSGEHSAALARGLYAGGAVLVAAGVTLLLLRPGDPKPNATVAVAFDAHSATAAWRGSF